MDQLLYLFASTIIKVFQAFPLNFLGRVGRCFGGLFYFIDARHRRVAIRNLTMCFGAEKSPAEIRALARENFQRIGENFVSAIKMVSVAHDQIDDRVELVGVEKLTAHAQDHPGTSIIM